MANTLCTAATARSMSVSLVCQLQTDTRASRTTPGRPTEERLSALHDPRNDLVGPRIVIDCRRARLGTEKSEQSLVDSRCPHDLGARQVSDPRHEHASVVTRPIDEIRDGLTSELTEGGIRRRRPTNRRREPAPTGVSAPATEREWELPRCDAPSLHPEELSGGF